MNQSVEFNRRCAGELSEVGKCKLQKQRTVTLLVALHRIPPPKESMKRFVENHRLKRAYRILRNKLRFLSNRKINCGNSE
jgi:hypothetical protein